MIKLSKSCIGDEEKRAINRVLESEYLGMGQEVMLFEKELERFFLNKVHVACVNTGTSALQLALQACGVGPGDEVIIPSITYVASFQATSATGARPIACDIDFNSGCLDVEAFRKRINSKTKAVMYVHYAGGVGERDSIFECAREFGLRVIEDAAHSFGGYYKNNTIGSNGDVVCFSFDGIKNITCGEGGAIVSSDQKLIDKIRDLRLLGVQKDTERRYEGKRSWDFDVEEQGWRYHMSNMNAAMGREQLKKIDVFGDKRRSFAKLYMDHLKDDLIKFIDMDYEKSIPHIFPILVEESHRDTLRHLLLENGVETGLHYKPNHLLTKFIGNDCLNAERFYRSVLTLPLHVDLNGQDVIKITSLVNHNLKQS